MYIIIIQIYDWEKFNPPKTLLEKINDITLYLCGYDGGTVCVYMVGKNDDNNMILWKCYEYDICSYILFIFRICEDCSSDPFITYINYNQESNAIVVGMKTGHILLLLLNGIYIYCR